MEIFKLMFIFENKLTHRLKIAAKTMQYCQKMGEITTNNHKITTKIHKISTKKMQNCHKKTEFPQEAKLPRKEAKLPQKWVKLLQIITNHHTNKTFP